MKIFFCTTTFQKITTGPSKFAHFLAHFKCDKTHQVYIFTEDTAQTNLSSRIIKVDLSKNLISSKIGMLTRAADYYVAVRNFVKKGVKPDVLVFNNAIIGFKSYGKFEFPIIGMINDSSSMNVSFTKLGFTKRYFRHVVFHIIERQLCKVADAIIVNSLDLQQKIYDSYPASISKTHVLYKAVDVNPRRYLHSTFDRNGIIKVLFVKTDWYRGGLDVLIRALAQLPYRFLLRIVGPSFSEVRFLVESNCKDDCDIQVYGHLKQEDVFELLIDSDIFCTPSRSEALGVANMEALIYGTPVVYSSTGGIPEVMNYGRNGFESIVGNVESLTNAVRCCVENEEERIAKQEAGYKYAVQHFGKDAMLEKFLQICHKVIEAAS